MNLVDLVVNYWGVGAVIIGGGVFVFTHKQLSVAFAKKVIRTAMLAAEKGAQDFVLNSGKDKFDWVVDKGYALLPPVIKAFVSKALFAMLVQKLFDEAKDFIEKNKDASLTNK